MNHDQMIQTLRNKPHIYAKHRNKQETQQTTYMPQIPTLSQQSNYTLSTHLKQQQQAEHQPKQQTAQKQKKAWTVMTMTTGYGKQSVEEVRKEHAPEPQKCQQ